MTEEELIIFCIGCLISADNNFNNDQRSENIRALKMPVKFATFPQPSDKDCLTPQQASLH